MKKNPWKREVTPREKKAGYLLVSWTAASLLVSFVDPKWGVLLFVSGFAGWLIFARV